MKTYQLFGLKSHYYYSIGTRKLIVFHQGLLYTLILKWHIIETRPFARLLAEPLQEDLFEYIVVFVFVLYSEILLIRP